MVKQTIKKKTKKHYVDIVISIDAHKELDRLLKDVINDERRNAFACERSQIAEADKAICQIQKDMKSLRVQMNRIDSQVSNK